MNRSQSERRSIHADFSRYSGVFVGSDACTATYRRQGCRRCWVGDPFLRTKQRSPETRREEALRGLIGPWQSLPMQSCEPQRTGLILVGPLAVHNRPLRVVDSRQADAATLRARLHSAGELPEEL